MTKHPPTTSAAVQIEVMGSNLTGQQFMERTRTLTITRDGATILLTIKLAPESEVIVRNLLTNEEALARVVGHIKEGTAGHVYGIAFLDSSVDLWRVGFSEAESGKHTFLECSGCQFVQAISLTGIEMEIFESKGALTRHCEFCKSSTIWKQTSREVSSVDPQVSSAKNQKAEPVSPLREEHRRDRRTAVKLAACVRYLGREEVVACEDMSRGGFRFKGRRQYPEGVRIEAAVPYTPSNVNIFVSARIVYHQKLSDGSHRHGVTYLKTSNTIDQNNYSGQKQG
jgi:PilZ domain-containing protein